MVYSADYSAIYGRWVVLLLQNLLVSIDTPPPTSQVSPTSAVDPCYPSILPSPACTKPHIHAGEFTVPFNQTGVFLTRSPRQLAFHGVVGRPRTAAVIMGVEARGPA